LLDECFKPLLDDVDDKKRRAIETVEYQIANLKRDADALHRIAYDGVDA
jgi:hypothetical protein